MTRYLISFDDGAMDHIPDEDMPAVGEAAHAVIREAQDAGVFVFAGGLNPSSTATVVDGTGSGDPVITDGPYLESKEHLGGFWVVDVPDLDAAIELARRGSAACQGPVEVRPFQPEPAA